MDGTGPRYGIAAGGGPVLLIGIHRKELAFGERVAAGLSEPGLSVLRIPEGISGQRPRQDQLLRVGAEHQARYEQVALRVAGRAPLLIDLHCGQDDAGPGADLISPSPALLGCLEGRIRAAPDWGAGTRIGPAHREGAPLERVPAPAAAAACVAARIPSARTLIPRGLWDAPGLTDVGLEVFRRAGEDGAPPRATARAFEKGHRTVMIASLGHVPCCVHAPRR